MGRPLEYVLSVGIGVFMLAGIVVASRILPTWEGYVQFIFGVSMGAIASATLYIALHLISGDLRFDYFRRGTTDHPTGR
jgi:hypothetical protein